MESPTYPNNNTNHEAFLKGNDAILCGALAAGCKAFFGYPITPASEIAHLALQHFPKLNATAIQAESEVAAINMLYGAAAIGIRAMTATSGPGFSLMQEGISYIAAAQLPCVIVNIMRAGPGLGNIAPEQGDYFQTTKGGGHGSYHLPTFAPHNVQEMYSLCAKSFEFAEKYKTPTCVLADAFVGQTMEHIQIQNIIKKQQSSSATQITSNLKINPITTVELYPKKLEERTRKIQDRDQYIEENETLAESFYCQDAKYILVAFGICARIAKQTVLEARRNNIPLGLLRPITLWPFPKKHLQNLANNKNITFISLELNTGQMIQDIQLALNGKAQTALLTRCGGNLPTTNEILQFVQNL